MKIKFLVIISLAISVSIYSQKNENTKMFIYDFEQVEIKLGNIKCKRKKESSNECAKKAKKGCFYKSFDGRPVSLKYYFPAKITIQ